MALDPALDPELQRIRDLEDWAGTIFDLGLAILLFGGLVGVAFATSSPVLMVAPMTVGGGTFIVMMAMHNRIMAQITRTTPGRSDQA